MNSNSPPVGGKEVSNIFDVRFAENEGKIFHLTIGFVGDGCTSTLVSNYLITYLTRTSIFSLGILI